MGETQHDLTLTYDPRKTWAHFVLYTEPDRGIVTASMNGTVAIEHRSPYVQQWLSRLQRCEPNPLHTTLVANHEIPKLFHPCVDEDPASPSAIAGSGCVCRRTFTDPAFGLPVVGEHFRTCRDDGDSDHLPWKTHHIDQWTYRTYTPLGLRDGEAFASLIIDQETFWMRTDRGNITLLPQRRGHGYGLAGTGGRTALAEYIQQLADSDGRDTYIADRRGPRHAGASIETFLQSPHAKQTQELTLTDIKRLAV
ncbi:hypothetical protein GCM10010441_72330 [Kitasatospora paracochleata]|uniref:Uncharacterized protein n=1 Tax=Kitasatospora paracochleata TaxID=58354 RepID=A0ABT1J946_9ACTN|nr:hypothetical protein [Kitasatospora paracochleata]MCP2313973.1 hypothetical protein [Kitasatospora paracochleata]